MIQTKSLLQEQALAKILPLHRAGCAISMGGGKTVLGLRHMDVLFKEGAKKFLVVAPKKAIFQSWKDDAVKFDLSHLIPKIKFCTYLSLSKQELDYSVIYLDECHSLLYSCDNFLSNYKGSIIGLSGTWPNFKNSEKGIMVNRYCPLAFTYEVDDAVEDGILNDYRVIVHKLDLNSKLIMKKETKDGRSWMTSEAADYQYWTNKIGSATSQKQVQFMRIRRMSAIMKYSTKEEYARKLFQSIEGKCILFCNTIDQAHKMAAHSYTSKNPKSNANLEMLKSGEIDKLSCVLQLSEGINVPGLANAIILHSYSNNRKLSQRLGRCLRLEKDQVATINVLMYKNSIDTHWVKLALEDYDQSKISYIEP